MIFYEPDFLNEALRHAKTQVINYLPRLLRKMALDNLDNEVYVNLLIIAISTDNLELVQQYYKLQHKEQLVEQSIDAILDASNKYGNQDIIKFLTDNLEPQKTEFVKARQLEEQRTQKQAKTSQLKSVFLQQYSDQSRFW